VFANNKQPLKKSTLQKKEVIKRDKKKGKKMAQFSAL
jgi:hypothetical protein